MSLDVGRLRGLVPVLGDGWVRFDAQHGMQAPEQVISAVMAALRAPQAAPGGVFPASRRAGEAELEARAAVADVVGGQPRGVVLGPSPAVLTARLAEAVSTGWLLGDEVVVSRLDAPALVAPWLAAAHQHGAGVRWSEIEIETCELPAWQFAELVSERTRVVTVPGASPQVGTVPDVPAVAAAAREHGALVVVDLSAAAAYGPQDLDALGADVVVLDAAAWGGPPVGALVFRDPAVLDGLPSCSPDPVVHGAHRLEIDRPPGAWLAGLVASIEHLAGLDEAAEGCRRERLVTSMTAVARHHGELLDELGDGLRGTPVTVIGTAQRRVPLLSLTHDAVKAADVVEHLAGRGLCTFADAGDQGVLANLGSAEIGGVLRIGFAHYTTRAEVRALVDALLTLS